MTSQLSGLLRKIAIALMLLFSVGCVVAVAASRLPNQDVCLRFYHDSGTHQPNSFDQRILDTTNGRIEIDRRNNDYFSHIYAPDNKSIFFKPTRHQTDAFDIYLETNYVEHSAHLLQEAVHMRGDIHRVGDQVRWSRDSQRVAYLWSDSSQNFFLSVASIQNEPAKTVTPFAKDPSKAFYTQVQEWSADNRYFTVIDQILNRVHYTFWDADTMTPVGYPLDARSLSRGVWSPNGHTFAAIIKDENLKPSTLMIFNVEQPDQIVQVALPQIAIEHVMWSPDGQALAVGYLTCSGDNCEPQWHYELVQIDGTVLANDLTGGEVNKPILANVFDGEGFTRYSGADFDGVWSANSHRFMYLQRLGLEDTSDYKVNVFDLDQHQTTTIGTYPVIASINEVFHSHRDTTASTRVLEPIPYTALSDQFILPYKENGKTSVVLISASDEKPVVLVSGADLLIPPDNQQWQGQYWVTDWNGKDHIVIEWATGKGKDQKIKLTTADANDDHLYTFDLETDILMSPNFISNADHTLMGFKGLKDGHYNLDMLDFDSDKQTRLMADIGNAGFWIVNANPQSDVMIIQKNSDPATGGTLYLRSGASHPITEINIQTRMQGDWSHDGDKFFVVNIGDGQTQQVTILNKAAKPLAHYLVSRDLTDSFYPMRWSNCE